MNDLWPAAAAVPLSVAAALALDRALGEPPARFHPVVGMGHYLAWMGDRVAPRASAPEDRALLRFAAGAAAWCLGALLCLTLALGLTWAASGWPWWAQGLALGALLKPLLAWRMLHREVAAVEQALGESLEAGRARLAWLVSRDVSGLSAVQVRESAIESLAENLNDSVVAPLFWFLVAGLPGAAIYRFANTADAMWGYRGERGGRDWTWAGKWAARADDLLSWVPARITAALLAMLSPRRRWKELAHHARMTPSPNGGWPMAAMALSLGVQLGKPGAYLLNPDGRSPAQVDTLHALQLGERVVTILIWTALLAAAAFAWRRYT